EQASNVTDAQIRGFVSSIPTAAWPIHKPAAEILSRRHDGRSDFFLKPGSRFRERTTLANPRHQVLGRPGLSAGRIACWIRLGVPRSLVCSTRRSARALTRTTMEVLGYEQGALFRGEEGNCHRSCDVLLAGASPHVDGRFGGSP